MADEKKVIEIDLNIDAALKDAEKLRAEFIRLKSAADAYKGTTEENTAAHIKAQAEMKAVSNELKTQETLILKNTVATKTGATELDKLNATNAALYLQLKKVDSALDPVKYKKLTEQINRNDEAIKALGTNMQQAKMNIGNYTESIEKAGKNMGMFGSGFEKVSSTVKGTGGNLIDMAKKGVEAFKTVGSAVAATGIGLLVIAVSALYEWFQKSAEGAKVLRQVMAGLGAVVDTITGVMIKLGGALAHILSGEFKKGFSELGSSFSNIGDNIKAAYVEAVRISDMEKKLAQLRREDLIDDAKRQNEINKQREIAIDKTKSREERQKALNTALEMEGAMAEDNYKMELYAYDVLKAKAAEKAKNGMKLNEDEKDALFQAEANLINVENERQQRSFKFRKQISTFQKQMDDEDKALAEKKEAFLLSLRTKTLGDELKELELDYKERLKKAKELGVNKIEVDKWYNVEKQKIESDQMINSLNSEIEKFKLIREIGAKHNEALTEQQVNNEIEAQSKIFDETQKSLDAQYENKKISEDDYNVASLQNELTYLKAKEDINNQFEQQELERKATNLQNEFDINSNNIITTLDLKQQELDAKRKAEIKAAERIGADATLIKKKYDKADIELEKAKVTTKLALAGGFAQNIASIFGEQTKVGKAAAVTSATISALLAANEAYASLAAIPYVGPVLGAAAAAAALAAGYANVDKILSVKSGLPNESGGTSTKPSGGGGTSSAPPTIVRNISAGDINSGIVTRDSLKAQQPEIILQPTLVTDDVTNKQTQQTNNKKTATI